MHVALARLRRQRVEHLLHAQHVQRGDTQDLGLAALEQRRAVHPRQHVDLGRELADVGETATVDAHLVADDPLAYQLLGQRPERAADLLLATLELRPDLLDSDGLHAVELVFALGLADDRHCLRQLGADGSFDGRKYVVLIFEEDGEIGGRLRSARGDFELRRTQSLDESLRGFETLGDDLFGRSRRAVAHEPERVRGGLGLDHHDRDVAVGKHAACDDHVERRALEFGVVRERHPLALDVGDAHRTDRAAERQALRAASTSTRR